MLYKGIFLKMANQLDNYYFYVIFMPKNLPGCLTSIST